MTDEMVMEYQSYISGIAKKFDGYKNKEDLIQVGFIGLIKALKNYKESSDVKFTTYAYKYILGEMYKLAREDKTIKIGRNVIKLKNNIEKAQSMLSQKLLHEPTNSELATFLEMDEEQIEEVDILSKKTLSSDISINDDKSVNIYDYASDKKLDIETLVMLKDALSSLTEEERQLLNYSLNMTEREIGDKFNMSQVKVSRTLKKIKIQVQNNLK